MKTINTNYSKQHTPHNLFAFRVKGNSSPFKDSTKDHQPHFSMTNSNVFQQYTAKPLTTINMNILNFKDDQCDNKKIKETVTVKKINLTSKENIQNKRIPPLFSVNRINCLPVGFDLKRSNDKVSSLANKKNASLSDLRIGLRTMTLNNNQKSKVFQIEKMEKQYELASSTIETRSVFSKSRCEGLIDLRIKSYLSMIKQNRKIHSLPDEIGKDPKRKALKVKIRKGNNSHLVKELFKKRWWWTIEDDRDKSKPNFIWSQLKEKTFFANSLNDKESNSLSIEQNGQIFTHNHFPHNQYLGNKKALFYNMKRYYLSQQIDVFQRLPLTFHVCSFEDDSWKKFTQRFQQNKKEGLNNIWILKPGQNSNRGKGISVHEKYEQIMQAMLPSEEQQNKSSDNVGKQRTYIIQSYIDKPFLYNKRKFDIRCYMLLVNINNTVKGYWYKEGYIRTSSFQFQLNDFNTFVHLTNDAIQTNCENYGKYEEGNKVSYAQFQRYLDSKFAECGYDFQKDIVSHMKQVALDSIKASVHIVRGKKQPQKPVFEVFGLDFMIDHNFKPWLIQINTNPCIETSCLVLQSVIPRMLDDAFKLSLDLIFPPPQMWPSSRKHSVPSCDNKFSLIYDDMKEGPMKQNLGDVSELGDITQDDEVYGQTK